MTAQRQIYCTNMVIFITTIAVFTNLVDGFSSGNVPVTACETGPQHPGQPQQTASPYDISITNTDGEAATEYQPGQNLTGEISFQNSKVFGRIFRHNHLFTLVELRKILYRSHVLTRS